MDTYMKCGCVAQGVLTSKGGVALDKPIPACVVHDCTEIADKPDLSGRMAKCCDKSQVRPSSFDLAFFEYQGPGSRESTEMCKCGYHLVAHTSGRSKCKTFVARGPREFDRYYCGHAGWD